MLATIVTPSLSTAQVFFLIAIVVLAVAVLLAVVHATAPGWALPVLGLVGLAFVALGLLFSP
jgi:hypothetical protein